jgi:hypothetical protein
MNITCERARRAASDFPEKINLQEFDTGKKEVMQEWGISGALYIDGKEVMTGPPVPYNKIRKKIEKRVRIL